MGFKKYIIEYRTKEGDEYSGLKVMRVAAESSKTAVKKFLSNNEQIVKIIDVYSMIRNRNWENNND